MDRNKIGYKLPTLEYRVELGQLRFFSKTMGETNPIYFDEEAAQSAGYRSIIAPPTFAFSCVRGAADQLPLVTALDLSDDEIGRSLHGEQRFHFGEPICAGDCISINEKIIDIYEKKKKTGTLLFAVSESQLRNQLNEFVAGMTMVLIIQNWEV